jgi:transcriptional regulator with XRE-family HTH domain
LGNEIRVRRLDLGLLQRELAERIGVSKETVTNWELGRTSPREDLWGRLWRELGL